MSLTSAIALVNTVVSMFMITSEWKIAFKLAADNTTYFFYVNKFLNHHVLCHIPSFLYSQMSDGGDLTIL